MPVRKKPAKKRRPLKVFVSYSHLEKRSYKNLEDHFGQLKRDELVELWYDGMINPKVGWDADIKNNLRDSDIVILLVSAGFLNSYYCCEVEMKLAMKRTGTRKLPKGTRRAVVIPVLLRPCDWETCAFAKFDPLPKEIEYVDGSRLHQAHAWVEVVTRVRELAS